MTDLTEVLEMCLDKVQKVAKSLDKLISGAEKKLVLEIGSHTTKIVEYIIKNNSIEVTGGAVLNTPINSISEDRLTDTNTLANMLSQTLKSEKIKTKEFVVSIASKEIIIREMNVPNMRAKELKSFVQINSKDIFPVKLSNYVLGYNMIGKEKSNRVMIAAIPKDIILTYLDLSEKLGLNLTGINYSGYELYNFLDFEIDAENESYLAVDIGARNTNIVIISNGVQKFNKIIPKGSEETSRYISEELNCTPTKAEQLKRQYNTVEFFEENEENSESNIVVKYTRRCMDNIMQDVLRIMEFFNSNNPKNKISKVYIIGTAGKIKGVEEYFGKKLNIDIKALKILNKVEFSKSALKLKARQHNFINCFGSYNLKNREFYIIKGDLKFRKMSILLKAKFHKIMICMLLVVGVIIGFKINSLNSLTNDTLMYNQYIQANSGLMSLQREIDSKKLEVNAKKTDIENLEAGLETHIGILNSVEEAVNGIVTDAKVSITKYRLSKGKLEIRGKIELPLEVDPLNIGYEYMNIPYELEKSVKEKITNDIKIVVSSGGTEFTLEINV